MRILNLSLLTSLVMVIIPVAHVWAQVPELDWPIETVSEGHGFTEGASLAQNGRVYFSDMDNDKILRFDPKSGQTEVWQEHSGKSNGLYIKDNYLYACEAAGRSVVQYDLAKGPDSRKVLTSAFMGDSLGCPNDITVIGNTLFFSEFWIDGFHGETGSKREIFNNRVYTFSLKNGKLDSLAFRFETPNGVASSQDGKLLYVGDFEANKLFRAEVRKGSAGPFQLLADLNELEKLGPDGMTIANDGRIFLALYNTDQLLVLNSDGSPVGYLPTGALTSNCFFAADGKTLYITADQKLKRVIVPGK